MRKKYYSYELDLQLLLFYRTINKEVLNRLKVQAD